MLMLRLERGILRGQKLRRASSKRAPPSVLELSVDANLLLSLLEVLPRH